MPKIRFITILTVLSFLYSPAYAQMENMGNLETKKSSHFIIYFHKGASLSYIDELINQAEAYYKSITEELGFTRFDNFWTWNKRAKIYLFNDAAEYQKITKQPQWSRAGVNVIKKEIYTYTNMKGFFEIVLPHELGHIVFREFIGFDKLLPLWLDEGVACFLEKSQRQERLKSARGLAKADSLISLDKLGEIDKSRLLSPDIFYAESASIITFLLELYGRDKFFEFCHNLSRMDNKNGWKDALIDVYKFKDITEMNGRWKEFLLK